MLTLRRPYPSVRRGEELSRGGCQGWLREAPLQRCGCGLVAATDLLLYLHRCGGRYATRFFRELPEGPVPADIYDYYACRLEKKYFPVIPPFGLNAFLLAAGMNRFLRREEIPLRAGWGVPERRFWPTVRSMLSRDIPVILCIGIGFPLPWGREQVDLYLPQGEELRPAAATRAHYVTVTGLDDRWAQVSSWGREYYLRREDYDRYRRLHSCGLYSNILSL